MTKALKDCLYRFRFTLKTTVGVRSKNGQRMKNFLTIDNKQIPWPEIQDVTETEIVVPLQERYLFSDMWYLDTEQAKPIFDLQANIIIKNKSQGIVDVGCRHGPVNQILFDRGYTEYNYFGFDTSLDPIQIANTRWQKNPNIRYALASWNDTKTIKVNFDVDTVILSGVLLYEKENHFDLFRKIIELYDPKLCIIQEPYHKQKYWDDRLVLHTITNDMDKYKQYDYQETIVDTDIFSGRRLVAEVHL